VPITPSLAYLTDRVISRFDARQPALEGIERVQRGECQIQYVSTQTSEHRVYWQPLNFTEESEPIEDPALAAHAMHAIIKHCVHTQAHAHKPILLRLSGGLDSSIVAGCLSDVREPESITCHTYFDPRSPADVRPWARMAAEHSKLRHLEFAVDSTAIDLRALTNLAPSYDVHPLLPYVGRSKLERDLCAEYGATAVFTGDGGDSGFCSDTLSYALVEYLRRHGVRPYALKLARDVSLATHRSVWQVLTRSLRRWRVGSSLHEQQSSRVDVCQLVTRDILQVADYDKHYNHHWFAHCEAVPWPTIRRLGALCHPSHFYDLSVAPSTFAPHAVHPLYSQPVVETLLRIPLYVHFEDGRDRGLARRAFESELPPPIAQRLWKDRAPGFLQELIARHRSWLRELFLDGVLVNSRLLDRSAVERALSASPSHEPVNPAEIFRHLDIEIWARQWTAPRSEARSLGSVATPTV
jgi:asparagine synthase (glutamine-hydrolysing)